MNVRPGGASSFVSSLAADRCLTCLKGCIMAAACAGGRISRPADELADVRTQLQQLNPADVWRVRRCRRRLRGRNQPV